MGSDNANFYQDDSTTLGGPYWRTEVGEFENSESAYGTFDQGGNVWEFSEAIPYIIDDHAYRGLCGGGFTNDLGFRVSQVYQSRQVVPEPASSVLALLCWFARTYPAEKT